LFINCIDNEKKVLIWRAVGIEALRLENREKKQELIKAFVKAIISRFPSEK